MKFAIALLAVAACDSRPAISSCDETLHGTYATPSGRWMILDNGATLEGYPLFDDLRPDAAPRLFDLKRGERLQGDMKRRYNLGGDHCEARAPMRIAKCKANELQVVLADPQPPLQFAPCTWGRPPESRLEHWRRE